MYPLQKGICVLPFPFPETHLQGLTVCPTSCAGTYQMRQLYSRNMEIYHIIPVLKSGKDIFIPVHYSPKDLTACMMKLSEKNDQHSRSLAPEARSSSTTDALVHLLGFCWKATRERLL